jgi:predicted choloylglycine hydrolase
MYEITLEGNPHERGIKQGLVYAKELVSLASEYPKWLGNMDQTSVNKIRTQMVNFLDQNFPEMVIELKGIAEGSGISFDLICNINFVSAIGALNGCTNLVLLDSEEGPVLAKTSDIGDDFKYYSIQKVIPGNGNQYLAISWVGSLWAEVGINSSGLIAGQSSGPTQKGQIGWGIPTLQYPRVILEKCTTVHDAVEFCKNTPMAGKGLSIALLDRFGDSAIVEKSGNSTAVRYSLKKEEPRRIGVSINGVYCTNIFLENEMQGFEELCLSGVPSLKENSKIRLEIVESFFKNNPSPSIQKIENFLKSPLQNEGICQNTYEPLMTHFAYIISPLQNKMTVYEGVADNNISKTNYNI